MLSGFVVGIMFALGAGAWVYSKVYRSTGGNTSNALIVAAIAGGAAFLLTLTLFTFLPN